MIKAICLLLPIEEGNSYLVSIGLTHLEYEINSIKPVIAQNLNLNYIVYCT